MIDNFEQIKKLVDFSTPDTFYFVQIMKRRKENPLMSKPTKIIDNFYFYTMADFDYFKSKIIEKCKENNARAYINLNRLEGSKVSLHTISIITHLMIEKQYGAVANAYTTACGNFHSEDPKRWVVDIDKEFMDRKQNIIDIIKDLHSQIPIEKGYKILDEIPTRTGVHIISNPFNKAEFMKRLVPLATSKDDIILKMDVQKNSPTLLYGL